MRPLAFGVVVAIVDVIVVVVALLSDSILVARGLILAMIVINALLVFLIARGTAQPTTTPAVAARAAPAVTPPVAATSDADGQALAERLAGERHELIMAAIAVRDGLGESSLAVGIDDAFRSVGVEPVIADGDRFDPSRHRAVDREDTDDTALDGMVASTEHPGYRDHGRLIRPPEVVVYKSRQT